jgi:hypothetical protein
LFAASAVPTPLSDAVEIGPQYGETSFESHAGHFQFCPAMPEVYQFSVKLAGDKAVIARKLLLADRR